MVHLPRMDKAVLSRIEKRLKELGLSASKASKNAGLGESFIRDLKRKNGHPSVKNLEKLAIALDVDVAELLGSSAELPVVGLRVEGIIEAGNFRDISLEDQTEDKPMIHVAKDPRFPHARQYALLVSGDSMDKLFAPGSYVTCVEFADSGLEISDGLIVHVERERAGLRETTLKVVENGDGRVMLAPRSTNSRHKPIEVNGDPDTEIRIRGVVTGRFEPLQLPKYI